jgi:hypothetical protein
MQTLEWLTKNTLRLTLSIWFNCNCTVQVLQCLAPVMLFLWLFLAVVSGAFKDLAFKTDTEWSCKKDKLENN